MRKITAVILFVAFVVGCAKHPPKLTPARRASVDLPATESGTVDAEERMDITIPAFNPLTAAGSADQVTALFRGTDRKGAKTSIAPGSIKKFASLKDLVAFLPSDDSMTNHDPAIERDTMERMTEENRNVQVNAWIYAIKFESDDDWHVILGTDPEAGGEKTFFNAEISGLPASSASSRPTLLAVRESLAEILDNELPSGSGYRKYNDPIPVLVEGSLFFDIDHKAGVVGPTGMRPDTAWEIHPITKLQLR